MGNRFLWRVAAGFPIPGLDTAAIMMQFGGYEIKACTRVNRARIRKREPFTRKHLYERSEVHFCEESVTTDTGHGSCDWWEVQRHQSAALYARCGDDVV